MRNKLFVLIVMSFCFALDTQRSTALAQGSAFTYQGVLNFGGNPVNGSFDLIFTLFATNTGGVGSAGPVTNSGIAVSNGLFNTTVDFGTGAFTNGANWLQITVRSNGGSSLITLAPRQQLTSVPYAITASATAVTTTPSGMALIPAGTFIMGDSLDGESDAVPTNIYVSAFYMDINLVNYSLWQQVYYGYAISHGYSFDYIGTSRAANFPVYNVDWYDCVKWCNARSQQAGLTSVYYTDAGFTQVYTNGHNDSLYVNWSANGYRLPTEAEWEKGARGGLSGQRFPWGNVIGQGFADYTSSSSYSYDYGPSGNNPLAYLNGNFVGISPVGSFVPNGYGLYDMAGNLFQWCWDWYGTPYGQPTTNNPTGPASGSNRVFHGGCGTETANFARCAYRNYNLPSSDPSITSFRCVRGL
jgi:formylglycine-generating enzyme